MTAIRGIHIVRTAGRVRLGGVAGFAAGPSQAIAQPYPARPIRMVVPFTPVCGAGLTARLVAELHGAVVDQSVIVENRGRARGTPGTAPVAQALADAGTPQWGEVTRRAGIEAS